MLRRFQRRANGALIIADIAHKQKITVKKKKKERKKRDNHLLATNSLDKIYEVSLRAIYVYIYLKLYKPLRYCSPVCRIIDSLDNTVSLIIPLHM